MKKIVTLLLLVVILVPCFQATAVAATKGYWNEPELNSENFDWEFGADDPFTVVLDDRPYYLIKITQRTRAWLGEAENSARLLGRADIIPKGKYALAWLSESGRNAVLPGFGPGETDLYIPGGTFRKVFWSEVKEAEDRAALKEQYAIMLARYETAKWQRKVYTFYVYRATREFGYTLETRDGRHITLTRPYYNYRLCFDESGEPNGFMELKLSWNDWVEVTAIQTQLGRDGKNYLVPDSKVAPVLIGSDFLVVDDDQD